MKATLLAMPTTRSGIIVCIKKVEKTSNDATHAAITNHMSHLTCQSKRTVCWPRNSAASGMLPVRVIPLPQDSERIPQRRDALAPDDTRRSRRRFSVFRSHSRYPTESGSKNRSPEYLCWADPVAGRSGRLFTRRLLHQRRPHRDQDARDLTPPLCLKRSRDDQADKCAAALLLAIGKTTTGGGDFCLARERE